MKAVSIDAGDTVHEVFANVARRNETGLALINGSFELAYGSLLELSSRAAAALRAAGIVRGDRVAILSNARPEVVILFLACARIGAVYLGLGTRLSIRDLMYVFGDARPKFVMAANRLLGRDYAGDVSTACRETNLAAPLIFSADTDSIAPELLAFLGTSVGATTQECAAPEADDALAIIYTSGSTGAPKGALLSHRGLVMASKGYIHYSPLTNAPRALALLPVDHVGFVLGEMTAILLAGGIMVQLPQFDPKRVLEAIERWRVTLWLAIPTMVNRLIASGLMDTYDLSSLELVWWPGPLPLTAVAEMRRHSHHVAASYGLTEAAGTVTFTDASASDRELSTAVGRPHPFIEMKLRHVDDRNTEPAEILLRGPQLMLGYLNKPEQTKAAFTEDGWLRTGDLGVMNDGVLSIVGRSKELIRSGGYNILPSEVEVALQEHPAVVLAFVGGVPDAVYGETVHAALQLSHDNAVSETQLRDHLRQRVSAFKIPKRFDCRTALPLLANGKIDRSRLLSELRASAELQQTEAK